MGFSRFITLRSRSSLLLSPLYFFLFSCFGFFSLILKVFLPPPSLLISFVTRGNSWWGSLVTERDEREGVSSC